MTEQLVLSFVAERARELRTLGYTMHAIARELNVKLDVVRNSLNGQKAGQRWSDPT